jgi:lipoyl(octanoyl) transferase
MRPLEVRYLGVMPYAEADRLQRTLVEERRAGRVPDLLLLLEHPHVITLGAKLEAARSHLVATPDLLAQRSVEVHESGRGGDITYHGPGQLVGYPILDLRPDRCDVHKYVRDLEEVMIRAASDFGLTAHRVEGLTGAWVGADKLGAIGVRISRWITSHGFAFNVMTDLDYFTLIVPCGISSGGVTSVSRAAGRAVGMAEASAAVVARFCEVFGRQLIGAADAVAAVSGTHAESAAKW